MFSLRVLAPAKYLPIATCGLYHTSLTYFCLSGPVVLSPNKLPRLYLYRKAPSFETPMRRLNAPSLFAPYAPFP